MAHTQSLNTIVLSRNDDVLGPYPLRGCHNDRPYNELNYGDAQQRSLGGFQMDPADGPVIPTNLEAACRFSCEKHSECSGYVASFNGYDGVGDCELFSGPAPSLRENRKMAGKQFAGVCAPLTERVVKEGAGPDGSDALASMQLSTYPDSSLATGQPGRTCGEHLTHNTVAYDPADADHKVIGSFELEAPVDREDLDLVCRMSCASKPNCDSYQSDLVGDDLHGVCVLHAGAGAKYSSDEGARFRIAGRCAQPSPLEAAKPEEFKEEEGGELDEFIVSPAGALASRIAERHCEQYSQMAYNDFDRSNDSDVLARYRVAPPQTRSQLNDLCNMACQNLEKCTAFETRYVGGDADGSCVLLSGSGNELTHGDDREQYTVGACRHL